MGGNLGAWLDPRVGIPDKETGYGLNPLNIGGEADPDRAPMTAPRTEGLKKEREAKEKAKKKEEERRKKLRKQEEEAKKRAKKAAASRKGAVTRRKTRSAGLLSEEADVVKKTLLG